MALAKVVSNTPSNRERMEKSVARLATVGGGAKVDPIFALIEAHKIAENAYAEICAFEDRFPKTVTRDQRVRFGLFRRPDGKREPIYLHSAVEVKVEVSKLVRMFKSHGWPTEPQKKRLEPLLRELGADAEKLKRLQDLKGFTLAREQFFRASEALDQSLDELLSCVPTTNDGVAAFATYMAKHEEQSNAEEPALRALRTIAKAVRQLAA